MRQKHILTALAIFAVTGIVSHSQSLAEAWQGDVIKNLNGMMTKAANVNDYQQSKQELIHKVGTDAYSGMSGADMRSDAARSQQGPTPGDQSRYRGEYKYGAPSNESRYGTNPSAQKESSGSPTSPYSETIYGGAPTTPSADPLVRELNRDPR